MAGYIPRRFTCPQAVTHPSINLAQCRLTTLTEANTLTTHHAATRMRQTEGRGLVSMSGRNKNLECFAHLIMCLVWHADDERTRHETKDDSALSLKFQHAGELRQILWQSMSDCIRSVRTVVRMSA